LLYEAITVHGLDAFTTPLEGRCVDLPEGALIHLGADHQAFMLLVVDGVVFERGADPSPCRPSTA